MKYQIRPMWLVAACFLLTAPVYGQSTTPSSPPGAGTLSTPQFLDLVACPSPPCNFTVPAGVTELRGVVSGAGGGGGGVSAATATATSGLPGILTSFVMTVTPGQVISYTIGTGGTAGANTGGNGGIGGQSLFGSLTTKGGNSGIGSTSGNAAAGATATGTINGSILAPTTSFFITSSVSSIPGVAGSAGTGGQGRGMWGLGGTPGTNGSATDCPASNYGAGGSGAGSTTNTAGTGGVGCPGAILLW